MDVNDEDQDMSSISLAKCPSRKNDPSLEKTWRHGSGGSDVEVLDKSVPVKICSEVLIISSVYLDVLGSFVPMTTPDSKPSNHKSASSMP